jgi:DNA-binding GntR family transcriptional regulator
LGVSSTPVREAFGLLEAEGFVENRPHRGVVVAQHDSDDRDDAYELRTVLEAHAMRRVAARATGEIVSDLERLLAEASRALAQRDLQRARRVNTEFHQHLAKATGSPTLVETLNRLIARSLFFIPLDMRRFQAIHREHVELVAAIRRRDPDRAAKLLIAELERNFKAQRRAGTSGPESARRGRERVVAIPARNAKRSSPTRVAARG